MKLRVLLAEACVAVYLSLLALGWSACNSSQLYRLIVNSLKSGMWGMVFGGGVKVAQHQQGEFFLVDPKSVLLKSRCMSIMEILLRTSNLAGCHTPWADNRKVFNSPRLVAGVNSLNVFASLSSVDINP